MKTQIRRIGNSLGSTIPANLIKKLGLSEGSKIEISLDKNKIILKPIDNLKLPQYTEKELLNGLNAHNSHKDELASLIKDDLSSVEW